MRDYMSIGSVPADEECAQVGADDYAMQAWKECRAFIAQLRRTFGPEPEGAKLRITGNNHDYGTYYEVVCWYEDDNAEAQAYAFMCEGSMPLRWDDQAKAELGL